MKYLGIRTDSPLALFYLYEDDRQIAHAEWQADRQLALGLLGRLETFLAENNLTFAGLNGLFVFKGPGSFTGLRIGITVMNTLAYGSSTPIVGTTDDDWIETAVTALRSGKDDKIVLPFYGAEPRITQPRK